MCNLTKSVLILILILLLQLWVYAIFLKPVITTWGATKSEIDAPMAGDKKSLLLITSTRAILINVPKHTVWQWLMQLGADRAGFYSYDFIENALGYKTRYPNLIQPRFENLQVGDVVRGSTNDQQSLISYNFPVTYIKAEDTFVLENWGTFLLKKVSDQQTRLIIRTQEKRSQNIFISVFNYLFVPFHYIMERRMLIGVKLHAEGKLGIQYSRGMDILWTSSIALSECLIALLIFIGRGLMQSLVLPACLSVLCLLLVLLFNPTPVYSVALLLILCLLYLKRLSFR